MNEIAEFVRQHLIDPELCARCNCCEQACPKHAISNNLINFVVDPLRCGSCLDCIDACSTGAIDSWRVVPRERPYSIEQQLGWQSLPAPIEFATASAPAMPPKDLPVMPPPTAGRPQINVFTLHAPATATIAENRRLTASEQSTDLRHIVLDFGQTAFPVLEGQCLSILPPGDDLLGHRHHGRIYSVASPRGGELGRSGRVALTVKRIVSDYDGQPVRGICSNFLCDLSLGATVQVLGPHGATFLMPEEPDARLLMICTGTGIAPMRGMIERRLQLAHSAAGSLKLFYGGRTPQEMAYSADLAALPPGFLDLHMAYSRSPDHPRRYVQDLLQMHAAAISQWLLDARCYVYLCGLRGMEAGVADALRAVLKERDINWDELRLQLRHAGRYHVEVY